MSVLQTIESDTEKYYGTKPNITHALDFCVNFSVEDGEFVAIVGTSGSGKSQGFTSHDGRAGHIPTSGNVIVRDKELSKMNDEQLTIFPPSTWTVVDFSLEISVLVRMKPMFGLLFSI